MASPGFVLSLPTYINPFAGFKQTYCSFPQPFETKKTPTQFNKGRLCQGFMGWLANYRWLKSLPTQQLPKLDRRKLQATKTEQKAMQNIMRLPDVIDVYHAKRLTEADTKQSRREIDLIVLKKDRIVLTEIKHYSGHVAMVEGVLHQNEKSRGWSFDRLDEARKRLIDTMRETGIHLGKGEIHAVLALLGKARVDSSVNTGKRLTQAAIATSYTDLEQKMSLQVSDGAHFTDDQIDAIQTFFSMCGTWDELIFANGTSIEGDFIDRRGAGEWRADYSHGAFRNTRGWFGTFLFGPRIIMELNSWSGGSTTTLVEVDATLGFLQPGDGQSKTQYRYDHLAAFKFGYRNLHDWKTITLMESIVDLKDPMDITLSPVLQPNGKDKPKSFTVGDVVEDATVAHHHKDGTLFQLDATQRGMYFLNKMAPTEADTREIFLRIGAPIAVRIVKVRKQKGRTLIEVKTVD